MDSQKKDLSIFMNYRRLKEIKRCNNFPVISKEDVAQHSFYVALLAMIMADQYNEWACSVKIDSPTLEVEFVLVNIEDVLRKALMHDLEESFTSDLPWNIKHMNEEAHEAISRIINQRLKAAYANSQAMDKYRCYSSHCKEGFAGAFVRTADMLELALYCWEEAAKGNIFLKLMIDKCVSIIKSFGEYQSFIEAIPLFKNLMDLIESDPSKAAGLLDLD